MSKLAVLALPILLSPARLIAQNPAVRAEQEGKPIIVTATRKPKSSFDVPRAISVLDLDSQEPSVGKQLRSMPDALKEISGISVQKTGPAQGSPKIRGQTGFRTLLLVDGIRINTAFWRSGNVEYWNTVDPLGLERIEIVRGPGSVLYGSDAVAGVAQAFSKGPGNPADFGSSFRMRTTGIFRYSSAEDSFIERLETRGNAGGDFGWHVGISYKDFGEIIAGRSIGQLENTAYREVDGDAKLVFPLTATTALTFGFQHVGQDDGPRTHSTVFAKPWRGTTIGSDFRRDISQERDLIYSQYSLGQMGDLFDSGWLSLSYQRFDEEERRVRSDSRLRVQGVTDHQIGFLGRFSKAYGRFDVTLGFEYYHEDIDSDFIEYNPGGSVNNVRLRGAVADEASYDQFGLYAQAEFPVWRNFEATIGARFNYFAADADQVDPTGSSGFQPVHRSWRAYVGSAYLMWKPRADLRVFTGIAQSFRAPNLSDLTRNDIALSSDLEIPSTNLDPEKYLTFELGGRYDDGDRRASITTFYTDVNDRIQRFPTGNIVGGLTEVSKANVGNGYFLGFEAEAATLLDFMDLDEWEFYGYVDFVRARVDSSDPADPPKTKPKGIPPAKGQVGIRWLDPEQKYSFEVFVPMAYHVRPSDFNAAERRNTQRIPPDGLPGYALLGLRGSARLSDKLTASIAIENITNRDYRIFDSGINEPGTNFIFTLRAIF